MLADKFLMFGEGQALTVTAYSTDYLDFKAFRNVGNGPNELYLFTQVGTAFTSAGATTLTITLECDDNSAFSSPTVVYTSAAIPKASLVAGFNATQGVSLPEGVEQFLRVNYTVGTGPFTAGTITAGLSLAAQSYRAYPNIPL